LLLLSSAKEVTTENLVPKAKRARLLTRPLHYENRSVKNELPKPPGIMAAVAMATPTRRPPAVMATALHVERVRFNSRRLQAGEHASGNRGRRGNSERKTANGGSGKKKRPQHWEIPLSRVVVGPMGAGPIGE
jgi:hypothetical protein